MKSYFINNELITQRGLGLKDYAEILSILTQSHTYKNNNDLSNKLLVVLEQGNFVGGWQYKNILQNKKWEFILTDLRKMFSFSFEEQLRYGVFCGGQLMIDEDIESLNKKVEHYYTENIKNLSPEQIVIYEWLENTECSLACLNAVKFVFPFLSENYKLKNLIPSLPEDVSDFLSIKAMCDSLKVVQLQDLKKINNGWEKFINNWDKINILIVENRAPEASKLIKNIEQQSLMPGFY